MPTTRSAAKHFVQENDVEMMTTASPDMNGIGHSYATRSRTRSLSDSMCEDASSPTVKFPFFDQANSSATKEFLTPSRHSSSLPSRNSLEWDALSPIAKSRGSDASEVGEIEVEQNSSPPFSDNILPQAQSPESSSEPSLTGESDPTPMETNQSEVPDLESARQKVGQSSHEFIERIRTAALRRKMIMTRSRDQLLAKEKEQLETNAKSKAEAELAVTAAQAQAKKSSTNESSLTQPTTNSNFTFKARPLPPTTGHGGSGGLEGVPKVEKKPTTTPCSPLLGPRRKEKVVIKALQAPKIPSSQRSRSQSIVNAERPPIKPPKNDSHVPIKPFKARPIPSSVGSIGNAGQSGVPRVAKRPATVAKSPLLGPRRRSRSLDSKVPGSNDQRDNTRAPSSQAPVAFVHNPSPLSSSSPMLYGLKLVETPVHHDTRPNEENAKPSDQNVMPPYELRSTLRAKERAAYDLRRDKNLERKAEEGKQNREKQIQRMRRELRVMGQEL